MANELGKAKQLIKLGDSSFQKGDYDKAASSYLKAIKISSALPKSKNALLALADAHNGLGHALRSKGQYSRAKSFNEKALLMYRKLYKKDKGQAKRMVKALHYIGDALADLKQVDKALSLSQEELRLARRLYAEDRKNLFYLVYGLNGTAARLSNKKRFNEAVRLLNQSLRAQLKAPESRREKSYPNLSWTYHILGVTFLNSGDNEKAIENLKKSLELRLVIADKNKRYTGPLRNTLESLSLAYKSRNASSAKSSHGYL
jgi:tetratricopeptide (TPR) repeat protein